MTGAGVLVVLGIGRVLDYLGFVLFAGVLSCWALGLIGPGGARSLLRLRRLGLITLGAGAVLSLLAAAGLIAIGGAGADAPLDLIGGGALAELAVLVGTLFLLPDLTRSGPTPIRRLSALLIVGVLALTLIASSPVIRRAHWILVTWAAAWQLIGLAALVGASVVLIVLGRSAAGEQTVTRHRAGMMIRFGSVMVGIGAIATLAIDLGPSSGTGTGWAATKIIGLMIMMVLLLVGARRSSDGRAAVGGPISGATATLDQLVPRLLGAGLALGAVVMIISSWLPNHLV